MPRVGKLMDRKRIICLYGVHAVAWVAFRVLWWCRVWIVKHCGRATLVTRRGLRCLDYDKGHWLTPAELAREMRNRQLKAVDHG